MRVCNFHNRNTLKLRTLSEHQILQRRLCKKRATILLILTSSFVLFLEEVVFGQLTNAMEQKGCALHITFNIEGYRKGSRLQCGLLAQLDQVSLGKPKDMTSDPSPADKTSELEAHTVLRRAGTLKCTSSPFELD
jgi:hypothetical protein